MGSIQLQDMHHLIEDHFLDLSNTKIGFSDIKTFLKSSPTILIDSNTSANQQLSQNSIKQEEFGKPFNSQTSMLLGRKSRLIRNNSFIKICFSKRKTLNRNNIGDEGLRQLSKGSLCNLKDLSLGMNKIGYQGVKHLSNGDFFNLQSINLYKNKIGDEGAKLLCNGSFESLITLVLGWNRISDQGVLYLSSRGLQNLAVITLTSSQVTKQMRTKVEKFELKTKTGEAILFYC